MKERGYGLDRCFVRAFLPVITASQAIAFAREEARIRPVNVLRYAKMYRWNLVEFRWNQKTFKEWANVD